MTRHNVLFIMVDAMRADHAWGAERHCKTPALDRLVRQATRFNQAFSTASVTTCCTASILTGTYPFIHGIRSLADHRLRADLPTLQEVFQQSGYWTWAETTGPLVAGTKLDRGFNQFTHREYEETLDTTWGDAFLSRLQTFRQPWFGFLHLWELHHPRRVLPAFNQPEYGRNPYERAVSSLDSQLGRLFEALPENVILVITGDHGEYVSSDTSGSMISNLKRPFKLLKRWVPGVKKLKRFSPTVFATVDKLGKRDSQLYYQWLGHGFHVYDYLVHVPLLFYGPSLFPAGAEINQPASHVDIFPTLVSALGLEPPTSPSWSGVDLMPLMQGETYGYEGRTLYLEASGGRITPRPDQWLGALRTERYKYVRGLYDNSLPELLFDLERDPDERHNFIEEEPELASSLRQQLSELLETASSVAEGGESTYQEEEFDRLKERLQALGYLD